MAKPNTWNGGDTETGQLAPNALDGGDGRHDAAIIAEDLWNMHEAEKECGWANGPLTELDWDLALNANLTGSYGLVFGRW